MSRAATRKIRMSLAIGPMALAAVAWTVHLSNVDASPASAPTAPRPTPQVASGSPAPAVIQPAGAAIVAAKPVVWRPGTTSAEVPYAALAAYQRAELVINSADPTCHLDWTLLAGVAAVVSDHGRRPEPRGGTLVDTDAGAYDHDPDHDHAVGPLRLLPSTWSAIAVDGDGDGVRDPRDIDDAALAGAVQLCAGAEDLATDAGQRAAAATYDSTPGFADAVLAAARAVRAASTAIPSPVVMPLAVSARPVGPAVAGTPTDDSEHPKRHHGKAPSGDRSDGAAPTKSTKPTKPTSPTHPTQPGQPGQPSGDPSEPPTQTPEQPGGTPTDQPTPDEPGGTPTEQPDADLPVADYDDLTIEALADEIADLGAEQVETLLDYERAHADRPAFVAVLQDRLAELREGDGQPGQSEESPEPGESEQPQPSEQPTP